MYRLQSAKPGPVRLVEGEFATEIEARTYAYGLKAGNPDGHPLGLAVVEVRDDGAETVVWTYDPDDPVQQQEAAVFRRLQELERDAPFN